MPSDLLLVRLNGHHSANMNSFVQVCREETCIWAMARIRVHSFHYSGVGRMGTRIVLVDIEEGTENITGKPNKSANIVKGTKMIKMVVVQNPRMSPTSKCHPK